MASKTLQAQRFVQIINHQLDVLKEERNNLTMAVDECIKKIESDVDAWISGGRVNQTFCTEMSIRIQQVITLFIEKTVELSGAPVRSDDSQNMKKRFAILEDAVDSLKKTTEQVEDKIEHVDKMLKDVSTQQVNDQKEVEIFTNAKLKSEKKVENKISDLEKRYQDFKSNVDDLFKTVTSVDDKLSKLEDENRTFNVSINKLNKQISSVRTCSNDAIMSIQDLSKSVESTNQHYNEKSNKMNQLEISINLMSSQYTEKLENRDSLNKDKTDDLIGLVCQLLAKRLTPLEKLNETLNKKVKSCNKQLSRKDSIEKQVVEMSNKITELEHKCNLPKVGFFAIKSHAEISELCTITSYDEVNFNHGGHFDPSTGIFTAPLNGLYLITIIRVNDSGCNSNTKTKTVWYTNNRTDGLKKQNLVPCLSINQSVTRCAEILAGDKLYLEWETVDENDNDLMYVYFTCCMIQTLP